MGKNQTSFKKGHSTSQETRDKISKSVSASLIGNKRGLGTKKSLEERARMSVARMGNTYCVGRKPWNKDIKTGKISEEHRLKITFIAKEKGYGKWLKSKKQSPETIEKRRNKLIGQKRSDETRKKKSGDKHPNWQGGIACLPYSKDWTKGLKIIIRKRDKNECVVCFKKQNKRAFPVHHINYDKLNCNPENLITVCFSCHAKTNFNREYWFEYFNKLNLNKYECIQQ